MMGSISTTTITTLCHGTVVVSSGPRTNSPLPAHGTPLSARATTSNQTLTSCCQKIHNHLHGVGLDSYPPLQRWQCIGSTLDEAALEQGESSKANPPQAVCTPSLMGQNVMFAAIATQAYRESWARTLVCGRTAVHDVCAATPPLRAFVLAESPHAQQLHKVCPEVFTATPKVLCKLCGVKAVTPSTGVAVEVALPSPAPSAAAMLRRQGAHVLVLDGISNPGNVGTLVRTASAFGWSGVITLPGTVDLFNDKAIRSSKASCFTMPHFEAPSWHDLGVALRDGDDDDRGGAMNTVFVAEASRHGDNRLRSSSVSSKHKGATVLVLGNESQGLSSDARTALAAAVATPSEERSTVRVVRASIPMSEQAESLNVGVAGSILMHLLRDTAWEQQPHPSLVDFSDWLT